MCVVCCKDCKIKYTVVSLTILAPRQDDSIVGINEGLKGWREGSEGAR